MEDGSVGRGTVAGRLLADVQREDVERWIMERLVEGEFTPTRELHEVYLRETRCRWPAGITMLGRMLGWHHVKDPSRRPIGFMCEVRGSDESSAG